jgi:hypothetical protein
MWVIHSDRSRGWVTCLCYVKYSINCFSHSGWFFNYKDPSLICLKKPLALGWELITRDASLLLKRILIRWTSNTVTTTQPLFINIRKNASHSSCDRSFSLKKGLNHLFTTMMMARSFSWVVRCPAWKSRRPFIRSCSRWLLLWVLYISAKLIFSSRTYRTTNAIFKGKFYISLWTR